MLNKGISSIRVNSMNDNVNILNEYMSNIKVETNNLYNLHFNVIGMSFMGLHKKLQEYYENFNLFYDNIAERIKMLNGFPITSLPKIEEISTIKSMKSMDFSANQVFSILDNDFTFLTEYTKDLIKVFQEKKDYYTDHILTNILIYLEKELWMIKIEKKLKFCKKN